MKRNDFFGRNPLITLLLLISQSIFSQYEIQINTDRPDQGDGTAIVDKYSFQIENGINADTFQLYNNTLLRFGIGAGNEIRMVINAGKAGNEHGLFPLGFSMKQCITKQKNLLPSITLSAYYFFGQAAAKQLRNNSNEFLFLLIFQNEINDKWGININLGTPDFNKTLQYTTSISCEIGERITLYSEIFGKIIHNYRGGLNIDAGILYFIKYNLQIDIAAGIPLIEKQQAPYITTGFSWLFSLH